MVDYIHIQNYTRNGDMGISRRVFETIAYNATNKVKGASVSSSKSRVFNLYHPIQCVLRRDGQVDIKIAVSLKHGVNVNAVCLDIQKEVAEAIEEMVETVKVNIIIKVASIK